MPPKISTHIAPSGVPCIGPPKPPGWRRPRLPVMTVNNVTPDKSGNVLIGTPALNDLKGKVVQIENDDQAYSLLKIISEALGMQVGAGESWTGTAYVSLGAFATKDTIGPDDLTPELKAQLKGDDGQVGPPGPQGAPLVVESKQETSESGGYNVITLSDGTTFRIRNGLDGEVPDISRFATGVEYDPADKKIYLKHGDTELPDSIDAKELVADVADDTLTQTGTSPVKSSGIWRAIWGAISAPAASVYEWMVNQLAQKVDTENGKGLSANDYTTEEKNKLAGIDAGAQKNPDLTPYAKVTDVAAVRQLANENAQALANKAEKRELRYDLVEKVGDSVVLDDRACNYINVTTLTDLAITIPPFASDKARDFIMILECSAATPTISYESFITLEGEDGVDLTPEEGVNVYFFTEVVPWRFVVARKLITKLVENIPVTGSQLLRAMTERGIDSTAGNFADVMTTLGLTDTDTITNAVNAVMKG